MRRICTQRAFLLTMLLLIGLPPVGMAQPGLSDFQEVRDEVNDWYYWMSDLILVLGAIAGMVGGARVYANWQAGKHHIDQQVMGWFFACLFLSIIGAALRALYGVN